MKFQKQFTLSQGTVSWILEVIWILFCRTEIHKCHSTILRSISARCFHGGMESVSHCL